MVLQLRQEGKVIRGDVRVWAAGYVVVPQPLSLQWTQNTQNTHMCLREEDVVNHTLHKTKNKKIEEAGIKGIHILICSMHLDGDEKGKLYMQQKIKICANNLNSGAQQQPYSGLVSMQYSNKVSHDSQMNDSNGPRSLMSQNISNSLMS